ncbi:FMRFamide-like neuropeptide 3 [Ditylenchus destructor]|uniref:FMRFamide-like neuropeptide 3 n=1 Tax=Ditylenchus destructor TaxID=166010 RepID=A0AAD4N727_9BILA|nr:FMRFamide-like neuropeptide 3 [Ditylenchus destructor]
MANYSLILTFEFLLIAFFSVFGGHCALVIGNKAKTVYSEPSTGPAQPSISQVSELIQPPFTYRWLSARPLIQEYYQTHPETDLSYLLQYLEKRSASQLLESPFSEDEAQRDIRSPLGTMRFGKRNPLGTMRFGKRNGTPLGTMRFGKRQDPGSKENVNYSS